MDSIELKETKERLVSLLKRDFDTDSTIEKTLKDLRESLEKALPKDKCEDRISFLKEKFFSLDKKIGTGNYEEIKEQKKEILYQIVLERLENEKAEDMINDFKNLNFVFMLRIEDYEKLSYTKYKEIRGTCTTHPYAELSKKLPKNSKILDKLLDKTEKLNGQTPGNNRLIYCVYAFDYDEDGKLKEYVFPGIANDDSVKVKFSTLFPGHLNMASEFIKKGNSSASLMERFLAAFGVKNVIVVLTDHSPYSQARRDPLKLKLADYYKKEFNTFTSQYGNDLRKAPLGLL